MKTLYQTLEDRNNLDEVEKCGPFLCKIKSAWLGQGYYYWDTFLEYAKWWGNKVYDKNGFVICASKLDFRKIKVFDLDEPETLQEFREAGEFLCSKYGNVKASQVIEYLKKHTSFDYQAIRSRVQCATNDSFLPSHRMKYKEGNQAFLDTMPQIQVCILDKQIIGKDNFHVVYPLEYIDGYVI